MFKVWLEWDYGQDNLIFSTKEKAIQWVNNLKIEFDEDDGNTQTFDTLEAEGLCGVHTVIIDP